MENRHLISVIVPVYNVKPYLSECVNSVLRQSYNKFELILVDDGSADGSGEMCDKFSEDDERIKALHIKNGGPSSARNAGVKAAKGEYISFVDSDDMVSEDYLKVLYENAVNFDADVSMCRYVTFKNGEQPDEPNKENKPSLQDKEGMYNLLTEIGPQCRSTHLVVVWNKLIRRETAEKISFPDGRWHEDEFYVNYLMENAERFVETPAELYFYRKRPDSIVGENNRSSRRHLDLIEAFRERTALYKRACSKELYKKVKAAYYETIKIQFKTYVKFRIYSLFEKTSEV